MRRAPFSTDAVRTHRGAGGGGTHLAPMDWKLQDSEDTTQPSVSPSPAQQAERVKHFTETTQRVSVRLSGDGEGCVAYIQNFTEEDKSGFRICLRLL